MRTELTIVASPSRSPRIHASGGLSARLASDGVVHIISTAATPLGGDEIFVRVIVEELAALTIHTVAATVVLPGVECDDSYSVWSYEVEQGASLRAIPQAMIVAAHSVHRSMATVHAAASSRILLREQVQIGRCGEGNGFWSGEIDATIEDRPLLRHRVELGQTAVGSDSIAAPRASISELIYPGTEHKDPPVNSVSMTLARGGSLLSWQGQTLFTQ
ncbi:MAG: urease accessory protein UreD [Mycobacteriaceae bacterium]